MSRVITSIYPNDNGKYVVEYLDDNNQTNIEIFDTSLLATEFYNQTLMENNPPQS